MAKSEMTGTEYASCMLVLWSLFVTGPIWLVLLFVILNGLGDNIPVWSWILYWIYVPASLLGIAMSGIAKHLLESKD